MSVLNDMKMQYRTGGVEQKLIFWNIGAFILSIIFFYSFRMGFFDYPDWIALDSDIAVLIRRPWTLVTYFFVHAGFFHLLFNMIVLNFAGRMFLTFFSEKQFLGLYVLSGIFAGLVFVAGYWLLGQSSQIVGASAAIMAILVAATTYAPLMDIRLLLIGNIKLWHFTVVILVLDLMQLLIENTGGHLSHLGGAFFGFIYIVLLRRGTDLSTPVSWLFERGSRKSARTPFRKVHRNHVPQPKKVSKIVNKDKTQQQIDDILDKISRSGYDSLTAAEKEFLFKAGKQ